MWPISSQGGTRCSQLIDYDMVTHMISVWCSYVDNVCYSGGSLIVVVIWKWCDGFIKQYVLILLCLCILDYILMFFFFGLSRMKQSKRSMLSLWSLIWPMLSKVEVNSLPCDCYTLPCKTHTITHILNFQKNFPRAFNCYL